MAGDHDRVLQLILYQETVWCIQVILAHRKHIVSSRTARTHDPKFSRAMNPQNVTCSVEEMSDVLVCVQIAVLGNKPGRLSNQSRTHSANLDN